jgi:hypothetical protein
MSTELRRYAVLTLTRVDKALNASEDMQIKQEHPGCLLCSLFDRIRRLGRACVEDNSSQESFLSQNTGVEQSS